MQQMLKMLAICDRSVYWDINLHFLFLLTSMDLSKRKSYLCCALSIFLSLFEKGSQGFELLVSREIRSIWWERVGGDRHKDPGTSPNWKGYWKLGLRWWFSGKEYACNAGDPDSIPGLRIPLGERNGYPLQYSCLENSMDWGALWGRLHRVTKGVSIS